MTKDRRVQLFSIRHDHLISILRGVCVISLPGLPDDAEIVDVHEEWHRHCFQILVWSSTFDLVPDCEVPPVFKRMPELQLLSRKGGVAEVEQRGAKLVSAADLEPSDRQFVVVLSPIPAFAQGKNDLKPGDVVKLVQQPKSHLENFFLRISDLTLHEAHYDGNYFALRTL